MAVSNLRVRVMEIIGNCPVFRKDDSFLIEQGFILQNPHASPICLHSLSSLLHYHVALSHGIRPASIGLNKNDENIAYVQCLDPCQFTGGGTVVFKVEVLE